MTIKKFITLSAFKIKDKYVNSEAVYILNLFVCEFLAINKATLFLKQEENATNDLKKHIENIVERLLKDEPFQYILGYEEFYGYKFQVNKDVLIPRPETEELVEWILRNCREDKTYKILDIGTGTACIPITLSKNLKKSNISACDISTKALEIAEINNKTNQTEVVLFQLDILDKSKWKSYQNSDVIVSNPPYIPNKEKTLMANNVLQHEPHIALFVADDNALIFYETIAEFAIFNLKNNGFLFFECNEFNAQEVIYMLKEKHFFNIELAKDINGRDRMIKCQFKNNAIK